jgi:hypothetical protein
VFIQKIVLGTILFSAIVMPFSIQCEPPRNVYDVALNAFPVIPHLQENHVAKLFLKKDQFAGKYSTAIERIHQWLSDSPVSEDLCRITAFDIVSHHSKHTSNMIPEESLTLLNIFNQNNKTLDLQRAKTYLGQAAFAYLVAHPITNINALNKRQEAVRTLANSPALCRDIHAELSAINKQEPLLLRWRLHQIHGKEKKPYSPFLHELYARTGQTFGFVLPVIATWGSFKLLSNRPPISHRRYARDSEAELAVWLIGLSVLGPVFSASDISTLKDWQHLLITYQQFLESAHKLYEIVKRKPGLQHIPNIEKLFEYFESKETLPLREFLKKSTFKGKASIFSSAGNINYAQSLLFKTMGYTVGLMQAIGNIDAFLAVARLACDHELKDEKYCFVNFTDAQTSSVQLTNAWSPASKESVLYNFSLAGNNALISGVRNSGKTTAVQSICHALVMAQSFGVAPAESCTLCPLYKIIMTHVDNEDCLEITKLLEKTEGTPIDSSALVILDVQHRRITNEELEHAAQKLSTHPQITTIIVTSNTGLVLNNYQRYEMQETTERITAPGWNYALRAK